MKIVLYDDEEIESIDAPVNEVQTYIDLIKNHGFMDMNGNEYKYKYSRVDSGFVMFVYLNES